MKKIQLNTKTQDVSNQIIWFYIWITFFSRWYETVKNFDWSSSVINPENAEFAQLLWKATTHIGISNSVQQGKESYIVVLFDPRYDSTYAAKENVSPVKGNTVITICPSLYVFIDAGCTKLVKSCTLG